MSFRNPCVCQVPWNSPEKLQLSTRQKQYRAVPWKFKEYSSTSAIKLRDIMHYKRMYHITTHTHTHTHTHPTPTPYFYFSSSIPSSGKPSQMGLPRWNSPVIHTYCVTYLYFAAVNISMILHLPVQLGKNVNERSRICFCSSLLSQVIYVLNKYLSLMNERECEYKPFERN